MKVCPECGHIGSAVEMARHIAQHEERLRRDAILDGMLGRARLVTPEELIAELAALVASYRTQAVALAAQLAKRDQLLRDVLSDTIGGKVGGGDGNTYVTRPISGKTHNAIVQTLAGAK